MVGMIGALRIFRVVLGPYKLSELVLGLTAIVWAGGLWVLTACPPIDHPQRR
jgi:hypothetical protein